LGKDKGIHALVCLGFPMFLSGDNHRQSTPFQNKAHDWCIINYQMGYIPHKNEKHITWSYTRLLISLTTVGP